MAPSPRGKLRIDGNGDLPIEEIANFLITLNHAYNGVLLFVDFFDRLRRFDRDFPFGRGYWPAVWPTPSFPLYPPRSRQRQGFIELSDEFLSDFIVRKDRLILRGVHLESPGWWEVIGKLNPLEVLRQYLNDRHERRKDFEYRNVAERERLHLENLLRENQVLKERIDLATSLGATDQDLAPLVNRLLDRPLRALGSYQDKQVISVAQMPDRTESSGR